MKIILFITLIAIVLLIFYLFKNTNKSLLLTIILSGLIIYIILNPKNSINFTIEGTKLFFYSVFPSLFPFLVIVNLIFTFGGVEIYSRLLGKLICKPLRLPSQCSIVLLASTFCGYPLGARYASQLYESKIIDKATFERLLNIATNGSPLFIIGTVGTAMLNSPTIGYILLISNMLSCIIMGLIIPNKTNPKIKRLSVSKEENFQSTLNVNLGMAIKNSLEDAVKTCLSIGSFVIIFSVLINIIKSSNAYITASSSLCNFLNLNVSIFDGVFLGLLEITNGCNIISTSTLGHTIKVLICSFLIGFSGLSITSQVYSFIYKYNVSIKKYLSLKFLQGIICSGITFLIFKFPFSQWTEDVFTNTVHSTYPRVNLLIIIIVLLTLPVIISNVMKRFNCKVH